MYTDLLKDDPYSISFGLAPDGSSTSYDVVWSGESVLISVSGAGLSDRAVFLTEADAHSYACDFLNGKIKTLCFRVVHT